MESKEDNQVFVTPLTKEIQYNSEQDDQESGLNRAVAYALSLRKELVSVIWSHQDPGLSHHFTITYHDKETVVDENTMKTHQHWRKDDSK